MRAFYQVTIEKPETHLVGVTCDFEISGNSSNLTLFLPSWSPGSYLMREYARHLKCLEITDKTGERVEATQIEKGKWLIKNCPKNISVQYEVYAHELTVRTSHIDESHAFLHGPSYLMGVEDEVFPSYQIEFRFPPLWSKLTTGLKDISDKREVFLYEAKTYDELIDAPVEIGCQETDGFMVSGKEHELAFYGQSLNADINLKEDIKKIVEHISGKLGDIPYDRYVFMSHFSPGLYGGLEHLNSTALQFDDTQFRDREKYVAWLALVAHEYFHTWNVKRIRPKELGPFKYTEENYTRMLWLAEGLTSFMDDLFVYQAGLCTLEEYLSVITKNLQAYLTTPGKKFDSLEDSSFGAWVKLYRPDENSRNSSVSYYLKGGLVFFALNTLLYKHNKNMYDLIKLLWKDYKSRPDTGVTKEQVLNFIEELSSSEVKEEFDEMISTTFDIDFQKISESIGLEFEWESSESSYLGIEVVEQGGKLMIVRVELDSPAYKSGLNAGDEWVGLGDLRARSEWKEKLGKMLQVNRNYTFVVSRLGRLKNITVCPGKTPKKLKMIKIKDLKTAEKALLMN
jgi:predicted metalloprotease with PDZ domain